MSLDLNMATIAGRLTADPELKVTPSGVQVTQFTVAVNRYSKDAEKKADFINVVAWRETAQFVKNYFAKGSAICVVGSIQTRSWDDPKGGGKRYATEVLAERVKFVESRSEASAAQPQRAPSASGTNSASYGPETTPLQQATFTEIAPEDDLPF